MPGDAKQELNLHFRSGIRMTVFIDENGCITGSIFTDLSTGQKGVPLTKSGTIPFLEVESGFRMGTPAYENPNIWAGSLVTKPNSEWEGMTSKSLGSLAGSVLATLLALQKKPPCGQPDPVVDPVPQEQPQDPIPQGPVPQNPLGPISHWDIPNVPGNVVGVPKRDPQSPPYSGTPVLSGPTQPQSVQETAEQRTARIKKAAKLSPQDKERKRQERLQREMLEKFQQDALQKRSGTRGISKTTTHISQPGQNQILRITRETQTPRVTNNTNNALVSRINRGGSMIGSLTQKTGQNTRLSSIAAFPEMQALNSQGINSRISTNLFSYVPSNLRV